MLASPNTYGVETNMDNYTSRIPRLYLNLSNPYPLSATEEEKKFPLSVCDNIELGDEGAETIQNSIRVQFDPNKDSRVIINTDSETGEVTEDDSELTKGGLTRGVTFTGVARMPCAANMETYDFKYQVDLVPYPAIMKSQSKYGIKETVYKIPEIDDMDANAIALLSAEDYCDGEQSVGFKLKEMHAVNNVSGNIISREWQKYFPAFMQTDTIYDYSNDLVLSNLSNFTCPETTTHKITSSNFDENITYYVPKNTTFRIYSGFNSLLTIYSTGGLGNVITEDGTITGFEFKIYSQNDVDITSKMSYTIQETNTLSPTAMKMTGTTDIVITESCYIPVYRASGGALISPTVRVGGKINIMIKEERQRMPNKLCLSTFTHNFPEGTTKYWFGIMKPTDITQNTSEISNAIYNQ
jgi:hypothetical protein